MVDKENIITRINVVEPSELSGKHLVDEYREIVRVFALARSAQHDMHKRKQPSEYTLGTGHCLYFVDKLKYISDRYDSLCNEMIARGYHCNRVSKEDLHQGISKHMFWSYTPTPAALTINRQRIKERS